MGSIELDLLTVEEVADLLRVNRQTVRNWIDNGQLPSIRVGSRRVRVQRPALEAFIGLESDEADAGPARGGPPSASVGEGLDPEATSAALEQIAAGLLALAASVRDARKSAGEG